jgi:hypothetical protein
MSQCYSRLWNDVANRAGSDALTSVPALDIEEPGNLRAGFKIKPATTEVAEVTKSSSEK